MFGWEWAKVGWRCRVQPNLQFGGVKLDSIKLVLTIAISRPSQLVQLDISNAFLCETCRKRLYCRNLQDLWAHSFQDMCCLLKNVLYRFKQAPLMWYRRLKCFLTTIGFKKSLNDPSLFLLVQGENQIILFVYVMSWLNL